MALSDDQAAQQTLLEAMRRELRLRSCANGEFVAEEALANSVVRYCEACMEAFLDAEMVPCHRCSMWSCVGCVSGLVAANTANAAARAALVTTGRIKMCACDSHPLAELMHSLGAVTPALKAVAQLQAEVQALVADHSTHEGVIPWG